jgi:WD40 repeat protein
MAFVTEIRDGRAGLRIEDITAPGTGFEFAKDFWIVGEVRFSPDGRWLALHGMMENWVMVRDGTTGAEVLPLRGHVEQAITFEFTPDSRRLAVACRGGRVAVWEIRAPMD